MRILYLAFADLGMPRAWTIHVLSTCRELSALGHQVHLVTQSPSRAVPDPGFPWRRLPVPMASRTGLVRFHVAVRRGLPKWASELGAEVLYARAIPFAWWLPRWAHRIGLPVAIEVNGIVLDEAKDASRLRRWAFGVAERRQLEGADAVVAVTDEVAGRIRQLYPRVRRIDVVPNGVDVDRFDRIPRQEARRELGLDDGPWVGFVGGFFEYRALDRLVDAMKAVRARFPRAGLLLVGDGPTKPRIEAASAPGVRLVGDVPPERVPAWLAAMDVCVLLSTVPAGTSIKVFEYMAARRPIVASQGGGVGNLIAETGAGIAVEVLSPESISEAIVALLSDPGRATEMAERGCAAVHARFTWRRSAEALAASLERTCNSHRAASGGGHAGSA